MVQKRTFLHRASEKEELRPYYDLDDVGFIPAGEYHRLHEELHLSDEIIRDEYTTKYRDLLDEWYKKRKQVREKSKIRNIKELLAYIYDLSPEEKQAEIKEGRKKAKTMDEIINLFPQVYRPLLRIRYAKDKKIELDKEKEMESLVKTIEPKYYNPNAFIESVGEEI